jgi:tRNA (mo5U34)-methyltransferase
MYFIEDKYSGDATNWWVPNRNAVEGMLRSSGLQIVGHPEEETWICEPTQVQRHGRYIVDLEIKGELKPDDEDEAA